MIMVSRGGKIPRSIQVIHVFLICLLSLLVSRSVAQVPQVPDIPPPGSLRPPAPPTPAPASPVTAPQAPVAQPGIQQPVSTAQVDVPPGGVIVTNPNTSNTTTINGEPTLDQCDGAISRMVGLFIFEILGEVLFSILRFLVLTERLEWDIMKLAIIRLVYTIFPVIPFNFSCLWWGNGPRGSCTYKYIAPST